VLYILSTTFRAEANPSLEVALHTAKALGKPLVCLAIVEDALPLCMQGHLVRHPTDRAAAFRLEALRELQPLFAARGTALYVHVERDGCRAAVARSLSARACVIVTDEHYGIAPHATSAGLVAQTGAPVWLCDCHTTLPSATVPAAALAGGNAAFLRATAAARVSRLQPNWLPPLASAPPQPPPSEPPLWSVDLAAEGAVEALLAAPSQRDTTVGRLRHTRGGPRAALARWTAYVASGGLRSYASHRNNPLASDHHGASRMSAYINLGMICPRRVARDAQAAGAVKFLSEFVGFRESAHLWCLHHPGGYADASVAVTKWAREQLRESSALTDNGGGTPTLAALECGQTGDAAWDDCQRCLAISGELHNNVRMAWGKAIPQWHGAALAALAGATAMASAAAAAVEAPTAATRLQAALDLLVHLNDKFALDGGAAPSYGGLLWCLGWRDRPSSNGTPSRRPTSIAKRVPPGTLERRALMRVNGVEATALVAATPTPAAAHAEVTPTTATAVSERWSVEPAKSNRSTCKGCTEKIDKHALRIGDAAGLLCGQYVQWRHLGCQRLDPLSLSHHSRLSGFDLLSAANKSLVEAWFDSESNRDNVGEERAKESPGVGSSSSSSSAPTPAPPPAKCGAALDHAPSAKRARLEGPKHNAGGAGRITHFMTRDSPAALAPSSAVVASTAAAASTTAAFASAAPAAIATSHVTAPQNTQPMRQMPATCPDCGMDLSERGPIRKERHLQRCSAAVRGKEFA
jgi:deoxyribodipyrimidine photolyase